MDGARCLAGEDLKEALVVAGLGGVGWRRSEVPRPVRAQPSLAITCPKLTKVTGSVVSTPPPPPPPPASSFVPSEAVRQAMTPPSLLLISCATPMTSPARVLMGTQRILRVLNPVLISMFLLNRASAYASGISTGEPEVATRPAMPADLGMRI